MTTQQNRIYFDHSDVIYGARALPDRAHLKTKRHTEVIALMDLLYELKGTHVEIDGNELLCNQLLALDEELDFRCFTELRSILDATSKENEKKPIKIQIQYQNSVKGEFLKDVIKFCKSTASGSEYLPIFLAFVHRYSPAKTHKLYETYFHPLGIRYDELPWVPSLLPRRYEMREPDPDNPFDEGNIPFRYRDTEFARLEAFADIDAGFQIWAISGPSGAGKTRLAHHWLLTSLVMEKWDQIVIEPKSSKHCDPDYWKNDFELHRPTVLVMDYMDSMTPVFRTLRDHFRELATTKKLPHKVRLLLIDHVFPESLEDLDTDTRLGFYGMGKPDIRNDFGSIFFDKSPLNLKETTDQDELMEYLIFHAAGDGVKKETVTQALTALKAKKKQENGERQEEWYHPLFAILIGNTLKNADPEKPLPSPDTWNRRQLIENYLNNNRRLPWLLLDEPKTDQEKHLRINKIWAAACVAAATVRRGVDFDLLAECMPKNDQAGLTSPPHIKDYCRAITSRLVIEDTIPPLQPDILGETHFLLFIKALKEGSSTVQPVRQPFMEMLSCGNEEVLTWDAFQFIAFIKRLTRNLCNDNQDDGIVQEHWNMLLDFLKPEKFPAESIMRWAVSAALIECAELIQQLHPERRKEERDRLLRQVDTDALCQTEQGNDLGFRLTA